MAPRGRDCDVTGELAALETDGVCEDLRASNFFFCAPPTDSRQSKGLLRSLTNLGWYGTRARSGYCESTASRPIWTRTIAVLGRDNDTS